MGQRKDSGKRAEGRIRSRWITRDSIFKTARKSWMKRGGDEKGGNNGHVSEWDRNGQRTPDMSHPAGEGWVTMDTATDPCTDARSIDPIKATPLCFSSALSLWLLSCLTVLILMRSTSLCASVRVHQFLSICLTPSALPPSYFSIYFVLLTVGCMWFIV